jgi:hypothetical protein
MPPRTSSYTLEVCLLNPKNPRKTRPPAHAAPTQPESRRIFALRRLAALAVQLALFSSPLHKSVNFTGDPTPHPKTCAAGPCPTDIS